MTALFLPGSKPLSAEQVLLKYWDGKVPVNVEAIARRMGVSVTVYRFDEADTVSDIVIEDGRFVIRIADSAQGTRRQWALAHSLGHITMGHVTA